MVMKLEMVVLSKQRCFLQLCFLSMIMVHPLIDFFLTNVKNCEYAASKYTIVYVYESKGKYFFRWNISWEKAVTQRVTLRKITSPSRSVHVIHIEYVNLPGLIRQLNVHIPRAMDKNRSFSLQICRYLIFKSIKIREAVSFLKQYVIIIGYVCN